MLFNSLEFIFLFLPITLAVYFLLNKFKLINIASSWLILASIFFYSCYKVEYVYIILFSLIFNYSIGMTISNENKFKIDKKFIYRMGIVGNVLLLLAFKYFDLLIQLYNTVFFAELNLLNLLVPLGISFFTIQQIMYLKDCFDEKIKNSDFISYSLFMTFFPKLSAGPLVHYENLNFQFTKLKNRIINPRNIAVGILLFSVGLFKKVVVADYLSPFVVQIFDVIETPSLIEIWIGMFAYSFQIFFDFSGCIDMALGIGFLFNISLPQNFNYPYLAQNICEFWQKWNITFTEFLKENIYNPLNARSKDSYNKNIVITFMIAGIWYGANLTFLLWGLMHGVGILIYKYWKNLNRDINSKCSILITFLFVSFSFVLFRAGSVERFMELCKSLVGINGFGDIAFDKFRLCFENGTLTISIFLIVLSIYMIFFMSNSYDIAKKTQPNKYYLSATILLLIVSIMNLNNSINFILGLI